jgi:hypothetical protein
MNQPMSALPSKADMTHRVSPVVGIETGKHLVRPRDQWVRSIDQVLNSEICGVHYFDQIEATITKNGNLPQETLYKQKRPIRRRK